MISCNLYIHTTPLQHLRSLIYRVCSDSHTIGFRSDNGGVFEGIMRSAIEERLKGLHRACIGMIEMLNSRIWLASVNEKGCSTNTRSGPKNGGRIICIIHYV